ncbi:MAG TPA: Lar family restriction alleviation protein [Opitutaceae bacterium]|nr:Lar family restriction alleviation protein [Opitutaceae bacterium]
MAEEGQKLLPCPFCGGEAERVDVPAEADYDDGAGGSFIQCRRCVASTGLHYEFKENLVSSWNDRAKPLPAVERTIANEALRRAAEVARGFWRVGKPEGVSFYDCIADRIEALIKEPGHE